jgi:hypothetical protein
VISWKIGLLPPLGCYQCRPILRGIRPDKHIDSHHCSRCMDRLSNNWRCRTRFWFANGKSILPSLSFPFPIPHISQPTPPPQEPKTNPSKPIIAIQNTIPQRLLSIGMSLVSFSQTLGGALFLAFAQTAFSTALPTTLQKHAPGISSQLVEEAGASGFRAAVPQESVKGVVLAYNEALQHVFYIAAAASVTCFFFAWGIGWKDIRKKKVVEPAA